MKPLTLLSSLILATCALTHPSEHHHPRYMPTIHYIPPNISRPTDSRNTTRCHPPTAQGHMIFASPRRPDIELLVRTQWHIVYPGRMRSALMEVGFVIVDGRTERRCGWWEGDGLWAAGVKRGVVAWRTRNGTDEDGDRGREKGGEEEAEPPEEDMLELVGQVLRSTYPALEIALVVVGAAGAPFWLLLAGWVVWWLAMEVWCCLRGVVRIGRRVSGCGTERRVDKRGWRW
ncbi:hypothetical protein W97_02458 [Coniosporium apollinis CBS 100218]|uniref:Uncharacterized protein n=1 Tax=Coniosporium apollinis (strain CBS 100218) TaxID=1168221 RepID=R7YNL2_CONA1|nr:uncharacterized protein W97_02458 [Coniosporium apollinis CBS 100218]EON63231.1 hypothetical protein W97_02458 [Coniosporium apollinis CBS 100218]